MSDNRKEYKNLEINSFSLFAPRTKTGLLFDYPELRDVEEFKSLSVSNLLFVWYFSCEASPIISVKNEKDRATKAVQFISELNDSYFTGSERVRFLGLDFPVKVELAMRKMAHYRMGPRIRAKKMVESIMSNYEKFINVDVAGEDFLGEDGKQDFDKIAKYVTASSTVTKNIPGLIQQSEGGFSIKERGGSSSAEEDEDESLMDDFHESQQ